MLPIRATLYSANDTEPGNQLRNLPNPSEIRLGICDSLSPHIYEEWKRPASENYVNLGKKSRLHAANFKNIFWPADSRTSYSSITYIYIFKKTLLREYTLYST